MWLHGCGKVHVQMIGMEVVPLRCGMQYVALVVRLLMLWMMMLANSVWTCF
jgi:hypothetical protein